MSNASLSLSDLLKKKENGKSRLSPRKIQSLALHVSHYRHPERIPTGIAELDQLLEGGIRRGQLVEWTGEGSCGKTSCLFSILRQATRAEEVTAYVDAFDTLDPEYAEKSGIDLRRLLWVRCQEGETHTIGRIEKSLKALDVLVRAGGFGVIALDLATLRTPHRHQIRRIPLKNWFRLQRTVRGTSTVLVLLTGQRTAGSAASLVLSWKKSDVRWIRRSRKGDSEMHPSFLVDAVESSTIREKVENRFQGVEGRADLLRGENHGSVSVYCAL